MEVIFVGRCVGFKEGIATFRFHGYWCGRKVRKIIIYASAQFEKNHDYVITMCEPEVHRMELLGNLKSFRKI